MYSLFSLKSSISVMCRVSNIQTAPEAFGPISKEYCGLVPIVYKSFTGPVQAFHALQNEKPVLESNHLLIGPSY